MSSTAVHRRSKQRSAKQHHRDRQFLMWLISGSLVVLLLVAGISWIINRSNSATTPSADTSATLDESVLLPLARPIEPILGFHDMNRLPSGQVPSLSVGGSAQGPLVDLPMTEWDWGTIPRMPPVQQTFPIQNRGSETLVINSVVTSCGCTTAKLSSSVIPSGERADLVVTFDPDYHETSGPVTRLVWLETNDPANPLVELKADANVEP